jgi:hypothetical protein
MLVNGKTAIDAVSLFGPGLAALDRAAVGVAALGCHFQTRIGLVDILDANLAAILEANVDPIADAFVDDR